jgi:hypothetical protein
VKDRYSTAWAIASALGLLALVSLHDEGVRFPAAAATALSFVASQLAFPRYRPRRDAILCPLNWAVFLAYMQLIVLPATLILFQVGQARLPFLPTDRAINIAMLLLAAAHFAVAFGYSVASARHEFVTDDSRPPAANALTRRLVWGYSIAGMLGMLLTFRTPQRLGMYFLSPDGARAIAAELDGTWAGLLGTLLRPFLQFAVIVAWCGWVDRRGRIAPFAERMSRTCLAIVGVIAVGLTFGYNRGSFVYPLIALVAVYTCRVRRISLARMVVGGVVAIVPLLLLGLYRRTGLTARELGIGFEMVDLLFRTVSLLDEVQMYGQAPQFLAFLVEQADYGRVLYWGQTIVSSILFPIPVIGEPFRPTSGVYVYNMMIYGRGSYLDQVIPFVGELFLNLHVVGVLLGFGLIGAVTARLQRWFDRPLSALELCFAQYCAIWFLFLLHGSIAVVSQILIYLMWPVYAYYGYRWWSRARYPVHAPVNLREPMASGP